MQVSKRKVNKNLKNQFHQLLYQVIADIHNPKEAGSFLDGLLKKTELNMITKRLAIAYYLDKGRRYEDIKTNLAVSSATISTIAERMKKKRGFEIALKKIQAEEWAERWAEKITRTFKRKK